METTPMNVSRLIELLSSFDPNAIVTISIWQYNKAQAVQILTIDKSDPSNDYFSVNRKQQGANIEVGLPKGTFISTRKI